MSSLPVPLHAGKPSFLSYVPDPEPVIDLAEFDEAFPFQPLTEAELEDLYIQHLREGGYPLELAPLPALEPITVRPLAVNWSLFARPATIVERTSGGNMGFLTVEDLHGTRYTCSDLASLYAHLAAGDAGFVVPDHAGVWTFTSRLPEPPVESTDDIGDGSIPF